VSAKRRALQLHRPAIVPIPPVPPDRGRLLDAVEISQQLLCGKRSPDWVLDHVPGKMALGHSTKVWWEFEVIAWLDSLKETVA